MESNFLTLHSLLNSYPFGIELALAALLILGWSLGHGSQEYARLLHRSANVATLVTGLCGTCAALLICGILVDIVWFHNYAKLPFLGGLLLFLMVVGVICERAYQGAATRQLMVKGHTHS